MGGALCNKETRFITETAVLKIGCDLVACLRGLHRAGFVHNDLKPPNLVFGARGTVAKDNAHFVDFGMVISPGRCQDDTVEGCELQAGGSATKNRKSAVSMMNLGRSLSCPSLSSVATLAFTTVGIAASRKQLSNAVNLAKNAFNLSKIFQI